LIRHRKLLLTIFFDHVVIVFGMLLDAEVFGPLEQLGSKNYVRMGLEETLVMGDFYAR